MFPVYLKTSKAPFTIASEPYSYLHSYRKGLGSLSHYPGPAGLAGTLPEHLSSLSVSRNKRFDDPVYHIGGDTLQVADKLSVLGVSLNNKLKWNDHISKVCTKTNSDVRFINRILHDASPRLREIVYNALVKSKLDYCSTVWDPAVGYLVDELERVQRRGARMIFGEFRRDCCVTDMINRLEWQPLRETRRERRLGLFYKIYHGVTVLDPAAYIAEPD